MTETFDQTKTRHQCRRCNAGFTSVCRNAKYCDACRPIIQRDQIRRAQQKRTAERIKREKR